MSVPTVVPLFARPDLLRPDQTPADRPRAAQQPADGPQDDAASPSRPEPPTLGYGVCKSWSLCGCRGYRGDGTQSCQSCGHGFGAHY